MLQSQEYTTEYISGIMSLRTPQKQSLETLDKILKNITSTIDVNENLYALKNIDEQTKTELIKNVHSVSPTLADFEHNFLSLAFALATGVGKTRLMGAFITYLYTNYGVKNFFVVAPGNTVYNKLRSDLINQASEKYLFNGLSCFSEVKPVVYDKNNFLSIKDNELTPSDVHIVLFDIQAFDKENVNMKKLNEILGDSFYNYLSNLDDLVLLMDESHHYRADKGLQAINELNPVLGLELTATPYIMNKSKQEKFKNVVYEYSLAKAIEDGFVRTPYAIARSGLDVTNFGLDELDRTILQDGIKCHEEIKEKLKDYAYATQKKLVKPFMMIVCKDIEHATKIENYVCSKEFCNGRYTNKVVRIDSKKSGAETEANTKLLLSIEQENNPIEIVIHVNMLKEGWDVNNLYTIVPLRTATSKTLREQMVGRGLRLPFGKRTGNKDLDGVYLTAHDNFKEILKDAESGESIFSAKHIIDIADISNLSTTYIQPRLFETPTQEEEQVKLFLQNANIPVTQNTITFGKEMYKSIGQNINQTMAKNNTTELEQDKVDEIINNVQEERVNKIKENPVLQEELGIKDIGDNLTQSMPLFVKQIESEVKETAIKMAKSFISIPQISTSEKANAIYEFLDFELDTSSFIQEPQENKVVIQNMNDVSDRTQKKNDSFVTPDNLNIIEELSTLLYKEPEINFMKQEDRLLVHKLICSLIKFYAKKNYTKQQIQNIVFYHKNAIAKEIYTQMLLHFAQHGKDELISTITSVRYVYNTPSYSIAFEKDFYTNEYKKENLNIRQVIFYGMKKSVFERVSFDSHDGELTFARIIDRDKTVQKWLRPDSTVFNLTYEFEGKTHKYEPDFVVETTDTKYLVEVKKDEDLQNAKVLEKKKCGENYCELVTAWAKCNQEKTWEYLFIPSSVASDETLSFSDFVNKFNCNNQ